MAQDESFAGLMARLRAGDQDAAAVVFHRFAQGLIHLARGQLDTALRRKVDPEDVVQSAFKSFFRGQAEGDWDLDDWDGLWGLLARITLLKCGHQVEHFRAARRDVRREAADPPAAAESGAGWDALAREPTPSEAAVLAETVQELMRSLEGRDRAIVSLRLQGYTAAEISDQLDRPERTVYRVLQRAQERLQRLRDGGVAAP
jgi:RNA polymerase sigma-70 factor (ECF subfamily)